MGKKKSQEFAKVCCVNSREEKDQDFAMIHFAKLKEEISAMIHFVKSDKETIKNSARLRWGITGIGCHPSMMCLRRLKDKSEQDLRENHSYLMDYSLDYCRHTADICRLQKNIWKLLLTSFVKHLTFSPPPLIIFLILPLYMK